MTGLATFLAGVATGVGACVVALLVIGAACWRAVKDAEW